MASLTQLVCFDSVKYCYAALIFVYDIDST